MAWLNYDLQDAFSTCPFVEILSRKHHTCVQLDQVGVSSCASSTCPALQSFFHTLHKNASFLHVQGVSFQYVILIDPNRQFCNHNKNRALFCHLDVLFCDSLKFS